MKNLNFSVFCTVFFCSSLLSFSENNNPIEFSANYINEIGSVFFGGKQKGIKMMGRGSLILNIITENMGLWDGGSVKIVGNVTHGGNFSDELVGDYQVASNIDAGDHTYIHELFYQQNLGSFCLKFGVQDLNADFLVTEYGTYFLNSSFGVPSVISHGLPAPIYPLTAMGGVIKYTFDDKLSFQTSIYDGLPISFENNPYNTNWHLNSKHGFQFFNELSLVTNIIRNYNTNIKIGLYHHTGINDTKSKYFGEYTQKIGYYGIVDQEILNNNPTTISVFAQTTYSPSTKETDNNLYIGLGAVVSNYLSFLDDNKIGLAFAYSKFNTTEYRYELAIETFLRFNVTKVLTIQPDLQYIINPSGGIYYRQKNAFIGFLRLILEN